VRLSTSCCVSLRAHRSTVAFSGKSRDRLDSRGRSSKSKSSSTEMEKICTDFSRELQIADEVVILAGAPRSMLSSSRPRPKRRSSSAAQSPAARSEQTTTTSAVLIRNRLAVPAKLAVTFVRAAFGRGAEVADVADDLASSSTNMLCQLPGPTESELHSAGDIAITWSRAAGPRSQSHYLHRWEMPGTFSCEAQTADEVVILAGAPRSMLSSSHPRPKRRSSSAAQPPAARSAQTTSTSTVLIRNRLSARVKLAVRMSSPIEVTFVRAGFGREAEVGDVPEPPARLSTICRVSSRPGPNRRSPSTARPPIASSRVQIHSSPSCREPSSRRGPQRNSGFAPAVFSP